jgi:hypothetical protein
MILGSIFSSDTGSAVLLLLPLTLHVCSFLQRSSSDISYLEYLR